MPHNFSFAPFKGIFIHFWLFWTYPPPPTPAKQFWNRIILYGLRQYFLEHTKLMARLRIHKLIIGFLFKWKIADSLPPVGEWLSCVYICRILVCLSCINVLFLKYISDSISLSSPVFLWLSVSIVCVCVCCVCVCALLTIIPRSRGD